MRSQATLKVIALRFGVVFDVGSDIPCFDSLLKFKESRSLIKYCLV